MADCPLCGRELHEPTAQNHHLIPKMYGGTELVRIHSVCHQKIHATLSEYELRTFYHTTERLREHLELQKFFKWVSKKPPEYYDKNEQTSKRKKQRKYK